jgi:hypothetical protein
MLRARNDARGAAHNAWVVRMEALEARLRTQALAHENRAIVARLAELR